MCSLRRSRLPFGRPQTPQTPQTPPQAFQGNNSRSTCLSHAFLRAFKAAVWLALKPLNRPASRPRQPLSQLQAPAMCFLRRSRLPFGRPQTAQTPQTVPLASYKPPTSQTPPGLTEGPSIGDKSFVIHRLSWAYVCSGTYHFVFLHGLPGRVMLDVNLPQRTG